MGLEWKWNTFECILVAMAVLETIIGFAQLSLGPNANISLFRMVRLFRVTRILRVCRLLIFVDLVMMINGTLGGFRTLLWSFVLVAFPLYALAIIFRETLGNMA